MSFITFYENESVQIFTFLPLGGNVNTIVSNFDGVVSEYDINVIYAYSIDGTTYSDYSTENVFNVIIQTLAYNKIHVRAQVSVKPKISTYNTIFFRSLLADGVPMCVEAVSFPKQNSVVHSCLNANLWRYHDDLESVHEMRKALSYALSNNMGFDGHYFRTDNTGKNMTFKTYTIHNVTEDSKIKVIINAENTPKDDLHIDEFQMYYGGIKVFIDRTEWDNNFSAPPTPKDSIWLPMFKRRMTVSKVVGDLDFMNRFVAYELSLIKYVDDASVNTERIDHITEDFGDYIDGAGIMQDVEETKEYIEASQADSSVQDSEVSKDMDNHNYHSLLRERISPLYAIRASIQHRGLMGVDWLYRSPELEADTTMLKYDVSNFDTSTYSLSFWASFSLIEDRTIYKTFRLGNLAHQFSLESGGNVSLEVFSGAQSKKVFTTPTTPLVVGKYYNFHINKTQSHLTITISEYDKTTAALLTIQEGVFVNSLSDNTINVLEFVCNKNPITLGMIKMNSKIVSKSNLLAHLFPINHFDNIFTDDSKIVQSNNNASPPLNDIIGLSDDVNNNC